MKVKSLNPFFLSDTKVKDFEKTFKKKIGKEIEKVITQKLV
jgi:hypothetical protein